MELLSVPVASLEAVAPGIHLMWLECPSLARAARPGQFIMVRCGEETVLRRPFSFHRVEGNRFALLFNVVGTGTAWLAQRQPGEELDVLGPLGNGFSLPEVARHVLLVAGGIGVAPLYFLAEEALGQGREVTFLYGTSGDGRCPLPAGVTEVAATEDGSTGHHGMITELVAEHLPLADFVAACGPLAMFHTLAVMPQLRQKPVQVSIETRMGCGFGVCYGCTIRTRRGLKQVCTDGPVFELSEVLWQEMVFF